MIRKSLFFLILPIILIAEKPSSDLAEISEAFGHLIAKKSLETIGVELDLELVAKGLQDAAKGKDAPLSETECIEALSVAQEEAFHKKAEENLSAAESFLKANASEKNVVSLEEGKVQYKIEQAGSGDEVKEGFNPLIKYVGKYLDGSIFGKSETEQMISLDETIPGFTKGLVGMKEGEKRTLYVHPEYGYGLSGYLPPNSLLTFEIELIKADAKKEAFDDALILEGDDNQTKSIDLESPQMR